MKNITSSSTCGTGLLQLQNNLSNSELDVAVVGKPEAGALFTPFLYLPTLYNLSLSLLHTHSHTVYCLLDSCSLNYKEIRMRWLSIYINVIVTDKRADKRVQHLNIYLHIENTYINLQIQKYDVNRHT